jgi:hypothetical protein
LHRALRLGHAIGRASGRRVEKDFHAFGGEHGQDSVEQRRLADAGPPVTTAAWRNGQKIANLYEFGHRIHEHLRSPAL